jgi:hypothetical protein
MGQENKIIDFLGYIQGRTSKAIHDLTSDDLSPVALFNIEKDSSGVTSLKNFSRKIDQTLESSRAFGDDTVAQLQIIYFLTNLFEEISKQYYDESRLSELLKERSLTEVQNELYKSKQVMHYYFDFLVTAIPNSFIRNAQEKKFSEFWLEIEHLFSNYIHRESRLYHQLNTTDLPIYSKANIITSALFFQEKTKQSFHKLLVTYLKGKIASLDDLDTINYKIVTSLVTTFFTTFTSSQESLDVNLVVTYIKQISIFDEQWQKIKNALEVFFYFEPKEVYWNIILEELQKRHVTD